MVTSANAQRLLCRIMIAAWLIAVCGMAVAALGGGTSAGNLLALLFTGNAGPGTPVMPPSAPAPVPPAPEPAPEPEPAPAPPPAQPPAAVEPAGWRDLPRGKRQGKGRLLPPRIEVRKDGSLLLLFGYEGTLGEHTTITPANVPSRSVDIHGQWSAQITVDKRPENGCVKRLQIASHPGWLRISAVGRDGKPLAADVSYSDKELRIIFHLLSP